MLKFRVRRRLFQKNFIIYTEGQQNKRTERQTDGCCQNVFASDPDKNKLQCNSNNMVCLLLTFYLIGPVAIKQLRRQYLSGDRWVGKGHRSRRKTMTFRWPNWIMSTCTISRLMYATFQSSSCPQVEWQWISPHRTRALRHLVCFYCFMRYYFHFDEGLVPKDAALNALLRRQPLVTAI